MSSSPARDAFQLTFELSPIILTYGIANNLPGSMLPIISLLQSADFQDGLLGGSDLDPDSFFAHFKPLPGASLIDQEIATYPFANQAVAANAVIASPLSVALLMQCPARDGAGYAVKMSIMTSLQAALAQHNAAGGTYTVCTPTYFYTNCLLRSLTDVSASESKQPQTDWRWDFYQPLLTLAGAQVAYNSLMGKIANGTQIPGAPSYSGLAPTVGVPPSLAAGSIIPAASGAGGATVAGLTTPSGIALQ